MGHRRLMIDVARSADGRLVARRGSDGALPVWDTRLDQAGRCCVDRCYEPISTGSIGRRVGSLEECFAASRDELPNHQADAHPQTGRIALHSVFKPAWYRA